MPTEVIELIAEHAIKQEVDCKRWCRQASTCSRLWKLQLPGEKCSWRLPSTTGVKGTFASGMPRSQHNGDTV